MHPSPFSWLLVVAVVCGALAGPVRTARAASTCNGFIAISYTGGKNFALPDDVLRVHLSLSAGSVLGGTMVMINRLRFDLDCSVDGPLGVGCNNDGTAIKYGGDPTITTTCGVTFTTGHAASDTPNQVVFTPNAAINIPANTADFCMLEFDIQVQGASTDSTPGIIEQVVGYNSLASDAKCDNNLATSGSQSGSIPLCPSCPSSECNDSVCNQDSGQCVDTPKPTSTPCADTDGNACTTAGCDGQGSCSQTHQTTPCPPDSNDCTADPECNPTTGACEHPPLETSTPCADTDGNTCTTAGCDGQGNCSQTHQSKVCEPDTNECTADPVCNPTTGACEHPPLDDSTPCTDTDGDKCTTAGCDGKGTCDQTHQTVVCVAPQHNIDRCNALECVPEKGTCEQRPIKCDDGDPCTIDSCDPSKGCVTKPDPSCQESCGPLSKEPCLITTSYSSRTYTSLQKAVDAVPNGTTITVTGLCVGETKIVSRSNLTIQGVNPTPAACDKDARKPTGLTSTITCPDGASDVIKVTSSTNIVIRYLNIVECETGVEFKYARTGTLNCNCCQGNPEDCFELHAGYGHQVTQNLITGNGFGINIHDGSDKNLIKMNTVTGSALASGILLDDDATEFNTITENDVLNNLHDGITLSSADKNTVTANTVTGNGTSASQDSGIELKLSAAQNKIDANVITGNSDGLVNLIRCISGSGNTGSNVTPSCAD